MVIKGFEVEEVERETSDEEKREVVLRIYNLLKDTTDLKQKYTEVMESEYSNLCKTEFREEGFFKPRRTSRYM